MKVHECYIKQQKVRNVVALVKHLVIPPRVFVGSRDEFWGFIVMHIQNKPAAPLTIEEDLEHVYEPDVPCGIIDEWSTFPAQSESDIYFDNVVVVDLFIKHSNIDTQQCTKNDKRGYLATNIYPEKEEKQKIKI